MPDDTWDMVLSVWRDAKGIRWRRHRNLTPQEKALLSEALRQIEETLRTEHADAA